jgi:hypothetical protein
VRAKVFTPIKINKNYTDATSTEVDVATVDELLADLEDKAPQGTRVIVYEKGTTHYLLTVRGWETVQHVVV